MVMRDELRRTRKEAVMTYFKELSQNLYGAAEKTTTNLRTAGFELHIFRI
jgi:hypothetical protein